MVLSHFVNDKASASTVSTLSPPMNRTCNTTFALEFPLVSDISTTSSPVINDASESGILIQTNQTASPSITETSTNETQSVSNMNIINSIRSSLNRKPSIVLTIGMIGSIVLLTVILTTSFILYKKKQSSKQAISA